MCLGAMCIDIGSYKGVFVTEKTRCIHEGIFTTCHEVCGAAIAHIVMANLAHACRFASSVCDGIDTARHRKPETGGTPVPISPGIRKTSVISDGGLCVRITYLPRGVS